LAFVSSIFKYFFKSPKKRIIRVCLNRIESMSLLWTKWHSNVSKIVLTKNTPNGIHYLNPYKLVNGPNEVEPIDGKMTSV
jgi:hypothetical protein